jgi:uncharacterized protein YjbI with pentapeptide repeats
LCCYVVTAGKERSSNSDAIRTAGTLVIGTGGAVALLLTARRQRYTELAVVHTERDATERRITELYTKAADQLGSDKAPVRLAGLYALERLAHSTVEHRQTIVNVICAYLRMPYTPPPPSASARGASFRSPGPARRRQARTLSARPLHAMPTSQGARQESAQQEQQVRLTAQDILLRNLRVTAQRRRRWRHRTPPAPAWPGIQLNLAGALLLTFSLDECQLDSADFTRAKFIGAGTGFWETQFTGEANFWGAQFSGGVNFWGAQFSGEASFRYAEFIDGADFWGAQFTARADFRSAQFTGLSNFRDCQFSGPGDFGDAQFTDWVDVSGAWFIPGEADLAGARVASATEPDAVWPPGWTTRPAKPDNGEDPAFLYLTKVEDAQDK